MTTASVTEWLGDLAASQNLARRAVDGCWACIDNWDDYLVLDQPENDWREGL